MPLAGRLLPTYWQRRTGDTWEAYRIDERKLNEMLAWTVENFGSAKTEIDVASELHAALREGTRPDGVAQEIASAAVRHLEAEQQRRDDDQAEAALAELPLALRRISEDIHRGGEALLPRRLDELAQADRASILLEAIASDTDLGAAAMLVWATERAQARQDVGRCHVFFREFGPLFAAPYAEQQFEVLDVPPRDYVPVPPWPVDIITTIDELQQIRLGLLLLDAIQSAQLDRLAELARQLRAAKADGISPASLRTLAADEAARLGSPGGDLGLVLKWFVHMATRWPFQVWPDHTSGDLLLPVPVGPSQLIWMVLGHNAGAFRLPFERANNLGVRFCAECGRTIFSSQPRKRGARWFCDPPEGKQRSVCANRFFSRKSKDKKRAAARAERGAD